MLATAARLLAAVQPAERPGRTTATCTAQGSANGWFHSPAAPHSSRQQRRQGGGGGGGGDRAAPARLVARAEAAEASASAVGSDDSMDISGAYCMPAYVTADNKRSKCFTVLEVEVGDYPGLVRVLAWTLNGLDVVAQNAVVRTKEDGMAHNTFWLTTRAGHKLDDCTADLLAERVRDFVMYCSPDEKATLRTEFCSGPIHISNTEHEEHTVVTVQEPRPTPGFLLEVASALSGMNVQIIQAVVQGGNCNDGEEGGDTPEQLDDTPCLVSDDSSGRKFKFWVRDSRGAKLDYSSISALVYTLSNVLGYRSHPTSPPNQELLFSGPVAASN